MTDQNANPKTNAAFVGALLTILANTAATITYTEPHIKIIMALAIYFLTMCLILEFSTTHNIPLAKSLKDNPETLKISYDFFIIGIFMVATLIISLTFKSTTIREVPTGFIISITLLILIYVTNTIIAYTLNHKKQQKNDQRKAAGETQTRPD